MNPGWNAQCCIGMATMGRSYIRRFWGSAILALLHFLKDGSRLLLDAPGKYANTCL
jgi:hypothetical protein